MTVEMVEHGITTTKAAYWLHFHPLDCVVYYYAVVGFRELIERVRLEKRNAYSGGRCTGHGYILSKEKVASSVVPERFVEGVDWKNLSGRQKGLYEGQPRAMGIINECLWILPRLARPFAIVADKASQFEAFDADNGEVRIEIKTDCTETPNIFVQTHELNHDVHALAGGGRRYTELPE